MICITTLSQGTVNPADIPMWQDMDFLRRPVLIMSAG